MTRPLLTFTGVDANTSAGFIKEVGHKYATLSGYRAVEFAILRSPKAGQSPRYPKRDVVERFHRAIQPHMLAYHLCGGYARMVHEEHWGELEDIIDFSQVGRVQVNSRECDEVAIHRLQRFSMHIGKPVIMQWRGATFPYVPHVDLLQDRSGGNGVEETSWSSPDALCKKAGGHVFIGYAGGLNPDNFATKVQEIKKAARGKAFWMDCESGVRTNDWFDTTKVQAMIDVLANTDNRLVIPA